MCSSLTPEIICYCLKLRLQEREAHLHIKHYKGKHQEIPRDNCSYNEDWSSYPFYVILYAIAIFPRSVYHPWWTVDQLNLVQNLDR